MRITSTVVVLDAPDLETESTFWAVVLGGTVAAGPDWYDVVVDDGSVALAVQLAPDHVAPQWPGGEQQQQLHLDLYVDDIESAHAEVIGAGATVLQDADLTAASGFVVYADPAGHPFCLCWGS